MDSQSNGLQARAVPAVKKSSPLSHPSKLLCKAQLRRKGSKFLDIMRGEGLQLFTANHLSIPPQALKHRSCVPASSRGSVCHSAQGEQSLK